MARRFTLVFLVTAFTWLAPSQAQEILHPDNTTPECIADWDPFCPSGSGGGSGGGGGDTSFSCEYCKFTKDFTLQCSSVPPGETGMTECTDSSDGLECNLGGVSCGSV